MRATNGVVGAVTLDSQASVLLASGSQSTSLAVLVHRIANPVDARIVSNGDMAGVNQNDLKVLVGGILINPVRVQHAKIGTNAAGALHGDAAQVSHKLELVDTLILGLTVDDTLVVGSLTATSANSNAVDDVALLGLVAKLVGLVSASRAVHLDHFLGLTVLPSSKLTTEIQLAKLIIEAER